MLEVIDAVRRVSGNDFPVQIADRRAGDPPMLVANVDRIRATLDWRPQFQDLDTIVAHALRLGKTAAGQARHQRRLTPQRGRRFGRLVSPFLA